MGKQYSHLSLDDRIEIEKRLDLGQPLRQIARALGCSPSTISRELKRGRWRPSNESGAYVPYRDTRLRNQEVTPPQYRAGRAQHKAEERAQACHKPTRLVSDQAVTYLCGKLRQGWTPEMISGRARLDFPGTASMWACPETIYRFIYAKENRHRGLAQYLPRAHKKRRKHHGRRVHSSRIPGRVSTTMDNGPEMHLHGELGAELGMDTYFADPYSSWQRGTNEHHNGRLRRYYPKGTDFTQISETELQDVITEINNQPRKCLGWKTPSEAFQQQLNSQAANQCCTSK